LQFFKEEENAGTERSTILLAKFFPDHEKNNKNKNTRNKNEKIHTENASL
jgi:hypothetical protein